MANGTHSSHKDKDEEINNKRPRQVGEKEKINSPSNVSDATGLRRSPREASSTKTTPSPSSTRKSERLEKRTPPTPADSRKSEKVVKPNMPSPLRRSGRNRNHSFSSPSDSKSSGSSSSKQKSKKEKSVKQLTFEANEITENDEHDLGTPHIKVKRMDARMYRATFIKPKKDCLEKPNRIGKSTREGDTNGGGKIDECCSLSGPVKCPLENNATLGLLVPSNATTHETRVASQSVQLECIGEETLQMVVSRNVVADEKLVRNSVRHDSGEKMIPSKRRGTAVDMDSNVSSTLANDNNCNLVGENGPSGLDGNIVGTDGQCSKRRRLNYDPTVCCYNESCSPSAIEDVGDSNPSMLQKECPTNTLTDIAKNICLICKSEGQLLFCCGKGCNGCYHPSCLEPPLVDAPIGLWHCHSCSRKKIELGVYSVSEGAEFVCDVREVPFSNDGSTAQREFLVKYKGLAHVHNLWVPENQLLLEAPSLLMKFNQKDQTLRLKPEWSLPHRLLQKRALTCVKKHDDCRVNHTVDNFDCDYEWLVKWRGLGYEHATWELDSASFLRSPESQSLIRGYEERFQRAKRVSPCSKLDKELVWRSAVDKLSQMRGVVSSGYGNNNLFDAVNNLHEHWLKGQSAIVIDDHERILEVVAFIATLYSDVYRPFLIISTAASLHSWEDEFYQLDPSIDVVIYSGNKEMRNSIKRFEFYDEGGCILFQVLIVVPEILFEDSDVLGGIEWEAIIVDECQSPKISSYFNQIKMLNTHLKVLLFRGQLKDSIEENINILALLDCQSGDEKDDSISNSSNNIVEMKKRLLSHIAYKCQNDFRFVEYWVPVQISNVQLEQYCAILLSNTSILQSLSKVDTAAALRDVLNSTRKCCNHPYVVDPSLQPLLTKGLQPTSAEYLDVGVKASGKLQLLDSMLKELKKKDLRALILFQAISGSGILDDFLRLRFGKDSYEGIVKGSSLSRKQSAMKKFNNKDNGCFIFLLETLACHSNIKLSSVDAIIIFNSDLNPMNDVRSFQKLTLDSQFGFMKIFRLYSSFTVEEKALIIAKQDKTLDINVQNISPSTSHMLLMWGASCLFDDLRVFHGGETSVSSLKSLFGGQPHLKVVREFLSILLSQDGEDNDTNNCSFLLKVYQNGVKYRVDFPLLGEQKLRFLDEEPPHIFWTKLLEGKHLKWKYSSGLSQRSRKKVDHVDGSLDRPGLVNEGISKKRRKVSNNIVDQPSSKSGGQKLSAGIKTGTSENPSGDLADGDPGNDVESEKNSRLHDEQRNLHLFLKPEIAKFCKILLLPDNVKSMVDYFLGYIINNHHVPREPVSILQAFQISLIWAAASFVKHNLDQKASLILAKEHLNFDCKNVEVEYMYSMLRCLKNIFLYRTGISSDTGSPKASETLNGVYSCTRLEVELFKKDMFKSIKQSKKKFKKKLTKLFSMQLEEKQRLKAASEDEKAEFERKYNIESAVIRCCFPSDAVSREKLKDLRSEYDKKIEELKCEHETRLKELEDMQSAKIRDFQDQEAAWMEDLKSWAKNELSNIGASNELGKGVEYLQTCDQALPHKGVKNVDLVSGHDNMVEAMTSTSTGVPKTISPTVVLYGRPVDLQTPLVKHIGANEMSIMASEDQLVSRNEGHIMAENEYDSEANFISEHSLSREQARSTADEADGHENFSRGSRDGVDEVLDKELSRPRGSVSPSSDPHNITLPNPLELQNPDGVSSSIHDGQIPVEVLETSLEGDTVSVLQRGEPAEMHGMVNFTDCPANATPVDTPANQISEECSINVPVLDNVLSSRPCGAANPSNGPITDPILNQQQISEGVSLSILDGDIPVIVPENNHAVGDCHNNVEPLTNVGLVCTTSDQQEGVPRTLTECTLSQETPVSRSVDVVEPLQQVQQLSSAESPPDQYIAGEAQNSYEQVGLVSYPVNVIPINQSNHPSLVINPSELAQQLTSAELPSSNPGATVIEPTNEDGLPFHDPEASSMVPNQDGVQPDSNLGLDSHSHQIVMHPASNSNLSSVSPGEVGTQSSETRNLLTPPGFSNHNHPIQTATHSASRILPPLCSDPLKYELERIQQITEQIKKFHEDMKLRLKADFEKEYMELRMKYDIKFQEIEVEFQQTKKNLDTSLNVVLMNKILADAFRSKCMVLKGSGALGIQQGSAHQLPQHTRQHGATHPSTVAGPSSCAPPAASLQSPSTTANSQNVVVPIQPAYNTSGAFSGVSARRPIINSMSSPSGSLQACGEMRAPAPHLQPYSPSMSVPATSLPAPPQGIPGQPAPSNTPASSAFSHNPPRPRPTTYQSVPHLVYRSDSAGGLTTANLSAVDLPNVRSRMSDGTSLNPSRVGTSNSSHEAPALVYLSDDD